MCGIAGSVNFKLLTGNIDQSMGHRGPDQRNGFQSGNVELYHLRLSILDITGGIQPMHLADRYSIIFNGEIYNHIEVRQRFNLVGKTSSDTETLLLLYHQQGPDFLQYLDGMFAFAIYDKQEQTLFLARDRAGKKPLYIYEYNRQIVFASELNCLKALLPLEICQENFYHYTRLGAFYKTLTPYKYVREMPAASYLVVDCSNFTTREIKWWNIHDYYLQRNNDSLEQALEKTDHLLNLAVKRRLESSDLEVGCFLSGGIDSGLVTALATRHTNKLKTFTVSFPGAYDEAPLARIVAEKYRTHHTEININFDNLQADVEQIIANYGEPFFDSSAIPSYYVSREAKKYLTVILNGDGADELFGGYRRYVPFAKYDFFKDNKMLRHSAGLVKKLLPLPKDKKSKYNYLYRLAALSSKSNLEIYLSAGVDILEDFESAVSSQEDYLFDIKKDFNVIAGSGLSGLQKIMNMDFDTNLFSDLLVKMDIATMAHSLEGRSPFLSKELLEYIPGLPDQLKIHGGTTKYLLRNLAKNYLPPELIHQPKRGFEIPLKDWVNGQLKEMINDYLSAPNAFHRNIIDPVFTQKLLQLKLSIPAEKRAKIIWMLFCMEVWYRKCYLT